MSRRSRAVPLARCSLLPWTCSRAAWHRGSDGDSYQTVRRMDLTKEYPRSPRQRLAGLSMLARTIDKARAKQAGTLGDYIFDCPMDRRLFAALRTDGDEFDAIVAKTEDDGAVV